MESIGKFLRCTIAIRICILALEIKYVCVNDSSVHSEVLSSRLYIRLIFGIIRKCNGRAKKRRITEES